MLNKIKPHSTFGHLGYTNTKIYIEIRLLKDEFIFYFFTLNFGFFLILIYDKNLNNRIDFFYTELIFLKNKFYIEF